MSDISLKDKSRNFWKALEYISKLKPQERMEITKLLVTADFNNPKSETTFKVWPNKTNLLH